ncbi:MAG TPA: hypothetical protein ENJ09_16270, partial [Planctomycetes bacterium]|nr:hypothetical protein [Planctomycetota bacterium]
MRTQRIPLRLLLGGLLPLLTAPAPAAQEADVPAEPTDSAPAPALALVGAVCHTQVAGEEPAVRTVLLRGERIVAVGTDLELPPGTETLDLTGKHLFPALIDGLVNFDPAHDLLYTATGVGFVRDIGGDPTRLLLQRDPEERARALGPSLATAG